MNRTTILMDAAYLMPPLPISMSQRLSNFGASWFRSGNSEQRQLESVRESILDEMGGRDGCLTLVAARVVKAHDITGLWLLRPALAAALTVDRGADEASVSMQGITHLFDGMVSGAMRERRSPLNH